MGIIKEKDERDGLDYDAAIKGADTTFWAEVDGTMATDTSGINTELRINSARVHSFTQYLYGDYEFSVSAPAEPGSGTSHSWGLRKPKNDTTASDTNIVGGGAYFSVDTDATFEAVSYDDFGNSESTTLTWDTEWNAAATRFRIRWENDMVNFLINDSVVATHTDRVMTDPQTLELRNSASTNMDVEYVRVARAGAIV